MTAPDPSRAEPRRDPPGRDAGSGLITLEWLLIVGVMAGLAASTALVVQRVIDDTARVPADPLVRLLQADVEAAFVAAEAQSAFDDPLVTYNDANYRDLCEVDLDGDFNDVVANAVWISPAGPDLIPGNADDEAARCVVTPLPDLGA